MPSDISEDARAVTARDVAAARLVWTRGAASHSDATLQRTPLATDTFDGLPAGHPDREPLLAPQASADPVVSMRLQHRQLQGFWGRHGARFARLWTALDATAKENVLHECVIAMPRWRGDRDATGRGQSEGICLMAPELNARDLGRPTSDARSLPALIKQCVSEDLDTLLRQDNGTFAALVAAGAMHNTRPERHAVLLTPDRLGETMEVKKGPLPPSKNPALRKLFEMGAICEAWVWHALCQRRSTILGTCAAVADEFRQEILGRAGFGLARASMACSACGHGHLQGDPQKPVLMCAGCGLAGYCSAACQKRHWAAHKAACRKAGARKKRAAAGNAGAAPPTPGGAAAGAESAEANGVDGGSRSSAGS